MRETPTIRICGTDREFAVEPDANLLACLAERGLAPDSPCGGKGLCGKCVVEVNGQMELACQTPVVSDIEVALPPRASSVILDQSARFEIAVDPIAPGPFCAFDIGTTTVVCYLLDGHGQLICTESQDNPQRRFGADVISRIQAARDGERETLTDLIRQAVNELLAAACARAGIDQANIGVISVVGNPCMQQLFLGMDVDNLAAIPFTPRITEAAVRAAQPIFPRAQRAQLIVVPDIAGYIGADTMGCILATRLYEAPDVALLVDIGTNGEMVLSDHGAMIACATAAGPALEGANISCGMRAAPGAIDHMDDQGISVIGGGEARGICGSGLLDVAAWLLRQGNMNEHGRLLPDGRDYSLTPGVAITQNDIRQLQLAKGAIAAGIQLMCEHRGLRVGDIDRCILAGAFGAFLDPQSACDLGLLPRELAGRIIVGGDLAGAGAQMLALNQSQLTLADKLTRQVEYLELSSLPTFAETFALAMEFGDISGFDDE